MNKGDGAPCPGRMRIAYVRAYPVWGGKHLRGEEYRVVPGCGRGLRRGVGGGLAGDVEAVGAAIRRIAGEPGAITGLCAPGRGESGIEPGRPVRYRRAVRRGGSRVLEKEVRELGRAVDSAGCRDSLMREGSWRGV